MSVLYDCAVIGQGQAVTAAQDLQRRQGRKLALRARHGLPSCQPLAVHRNDQPFFQWFQSRTLGGESFLRVVFEKRTFDVGQPLSAGVNPSCQVLLKTLVGVIKSLLFLIEQATWIGKQTTASRHAQLSVLEAAAHPSVELAI